MNTDINKLVNRSGKPLEYKVEDIFKEEGWSVQPGVIYQDPVENKSREIDFIVEKEFSVNNPHKHSKVKFRLFVEVKYISSPVVFRFDSPTEELKKLRDKNCGASPARYENELQKELTLYQSNVVRDITREDKLVYNAYKQAMHAFISESSANDEIVFEFPVVVCNNFDQFSKYTENGVKPLAEKINNNGFFIMETKYKSKNIKKDVFIYFVNKNDLTNFLSASSSSLFRDAQIYAYLNAKIPYINPF